MANDNVYGLAANIWTQSAARGMRFANKIAAGTVTIGRTPGKDQDLPWGGFKKSGHWEGAFLIWSFRIHQSQEDTGRFDTKKLGLDERQLFLVCQCINLLNRSTLITHLFVPKMII
jgi:Aldehyde dehydrogenase family